MGSIQQALKEFSGATGSWSLYTANQTAGDWSTTYAAAYAAVITASNALVYGTQADQELAPVRNYTPSVAPPTSANAQLGMTWDIYGVDSVNGKQYLLASIPTANGDAGGSSVLLPGTDQADPDDTLVAALFTALDAVALLSPQGNAITADSYSMFLNQKRQTTKP